LSLPDFEEVPLWTRFLADWCEPNQQAPRVGYLGDGDERDIVAMHNGYVLRSVFQPILSAPGLQPVAFEALVRAQQRHNHQMVSPEALFSRHSLPAQGVLLDRICRFIHTLNFEHQAHGWAALYLNVSTTHLQTLERGQHGAFMSAVQAVVPLPPERIILEILENQFDDRDRLSRIVDTFKSRGYRVAIDDFGARHSNFDRLWALTPDIVKIDRELLLQADANPRVRNILPKVVDIIHDLQAHVVCEGIETAQQHALATDAGVDFVQGYFFARPVRHLVPPVGRLI
jgi:EAL domain-containing protein (putative c-di-GMP-specific phosphodiesterase class I)